MLSRRIFVYDSFIRLTHHTHVNILRYPVTVEEETLPRGKRERKIPSLYSDIGWSLRQ
jgi:hypothetical protein